MATTVILGASDKPSRFSYKAQQKLSQAGHPIILVSPKGGTINGVAVYSNLAAVKAALSDNQQKVDTVTVYINPQRVSDELNNIIDLDPRRVIFNPGTESATNSAILHKQGIEVIEQCTLIMLDSRVY